MLTWHHKHHLATCLEQIAHFTYPNYRVVIVDNPAIDGTTLEMGPAFPEPDLIVNPDDKGYCHGCNLGLRHALSHQAVYILILDQNTVLAPPALETFLALFAENEAIGLANPKTYFVQENEADPGRLLYAGSWAQPILPVEQKLPGIGQGDQGQYDTPGQVDYAWGHALFIRAAALQQVGLFDETYFMYYEDLDLSRRMRAANFQAWYLPAAQAWYHGPEMGGYKEFAAGNWFYKIQSRRIFYRKFYGRWPGEFLGLVSLFYLSWQAGRQGYWRSAVKLWWVWLTTLFLERVALA